MMDTPVLEELLKKLMPGLILLTKDDRSSGFDDTLSFHFGIFRSEPSGPPSTYHVITLVVDTSLAYSIEGTAFYPAGIPEQAAYRLEAYARAWAFIQATGLKLKLR